MFGQMKQLMEMKKQADMIKKELEKETVDSEDVKGIKITINGAQSVKEVEVSEDYLESVSKEKFEKDMVKSINGAIKKSQTIAAKKMASVMPGMPGM